MQLELSEYNEYLIIGGTGNDLARYEVNHTQLIEAIKKFDRVPYIGKIECFECYVCNPETGESGWNIEWIRGIKEKIERYYPNFDCLITKDYPSKGIEAINFLHTYGVNDDYELKEISL